MCSIPSLTRLREKTRAVNARLPDDVLKNIIALATKPGFNGDLYINVYWRPRDPDVIRLKITVLENGTLAETGALGRSGRNGVAVALHEAVFAGTTALKLNDVDGIVLRPKLTPGQGYLEGAWPAPPSIGHFSGVLKFGLRVMTPSMVEQWKVIARDKLPIDIEFQSFRKRMTQDAWKTLLKPVVNQYIRRFVDGLESHNPDHTVDVGTFVTVNQATRKSISQLNVLLRAPIRIYDLVAKRSVYEALSFIEFDDGMDPEYDLRRAARQPARHMGGEEESDP